MWKKCNTYAIDCIIEKNKLGLLNFLLTIINNQYSIQPIKEVFWKEREAVLIKTIKWHDMDVLRENQNIEDILTAIQALGSFKKYNIEGETVILE